MFAGKKLFARLRQLELTVHSKALRPPRGDVSLSFNCDAPLRNYHYAAYPSGIITASSGLDGPALNHHLQLFFPQAKLSGQDEKAHVRFLPGMGLTQFAALGYLRIVRWPTDRWREVRNRELIADIAATLAGGRFIHAYVNLFFLPGSPFFSTRHVRYSTLLVGFERRSSSFTTVSYREDGTFSTRRVPVLAITRALDLPKYGLAPEGVPTGIEEITLARLDTPTVDERLIRSQLEDYLCGQSSPAEYFDGGQFSLPSCKGIHLGDQDGACGANTYALFEEYLVKKTTTGKPLDLRATRTLWEHKLLTHLALMKVFRSWGRDEGREIRQYRNVLRSAQRLHMLAFAYNGSRQPDRDQMTGVLRETKRVEAATLSRILETWQN